MKSQETVYYGDMRWPELDEMSRQGTIILLPIGQTEEHGLHLPVGCDYHISEITARDVARKASQEMPVLVMPPVWCGYSGRDLHNWPGVVSMPPEVVIAVLENICLSLSRWGFKKIVTMNSHGHHQGIGRIAARKVHDQCDACVVVTEIFKMAAEAMAQVRESELGGCNHAGEYETSLELYFQKRVDMSVARDEPVKPQSSFASRDICGPGSKVFWSTWRYQKSETGAYGSPTLASAEKGQAVHEATVDAYVELLREFRAAEHVT